MNEESTGENQLRIGVQRIAKNVGFLMSSQAITWVLAIPLAIMLPRYLGPTGVGQLQLAHALWAIGGVLVTFGLNVFLTKEISRRPERTGELYGQTIVLRLFFYLLAWLGVGLYLWLVDQRVVTVVVIILIGLSVLPNVIGNTTRASLQGLERMEYISIADVASKVFNVGVTIALLLLGQQVLVIAAVAIATSLLNTGVQFYYLRKFVDLKLGFRVDAAWAMVRESVSYFWVHALGVIYKQIDVIVIALLVNETVIGWYSAADRLFGTLLFLPTVLTTATFPMMSRLHEESSASLATLMRRSFNLLLLFSVPIGLGILVVADNAAVFLFGEAFGPTGPVLAIMGIVTVLTYQNILLARFAMAVDRQRVWVAVTAAAVILSIALDVILIPWTDGMFGNGAIGGALAYLVTETMMFGIGFYLLSRTFVDRSVILQAIKIVGAGIIMVLCTWPLRDMFLVIPVAAGAAVYTVAILALRALSNDEKEVLRVAAARAWKRIRRRNSREA